MPKTTSEELTIAIKLLEEQQLKEWELLKVEFNLTFEKSKPLNIIMNTLKEAAATPDINAKIISGVIGLTTNLLVNKFVIGPGAIPITKLLTTIAESTIIKKILNRQTPTN